MLLQYQQLGREGSPFLDFTSRQDWSGKTRPIAQRKPVLHSVYRTVAVLTFFYDSGRRFAASVSYSNTGASSTA